MVFACNLLRASANAREYEEQVRIGDKMGALQNVFSPNLSWRTMISSFFSAFDQFRTMTPIDVVDILVVAYIIYRVMKLLKDTSAAPLDWASRTPLMAGWVAVISSSRPVTKHCIFTTSGSLLSRYRCHASRMAVSSCG